MTHAMPDSIYPGRLPAGYLAYLGYPDGRWATVPTLRAKFPGKRIIGLTVTGATLAADGIDCEPGNPDAAESADWVQRKLATAPRERPIVYADLESPGYSMPDVLAELAKLGITRAQVRLLTAHYTGEAHICGPGSCGGLSIDADGTQWTDEFAGLGGPIDMSLLGDSFFGAPVPVQEDADVKVTVVQEGSSGQAVRSWQGLLVAHGYGYLIAPADAASLPHVDARAGVDGVFGPATDAATRRFQQDRKLDVTGVAAAAEWAAAVSG